MEYYKVVVLSHNVGLRNEEKFDIVTPIVYMVLSLKLLRQALVTNPVSKILTWRSYGFENHELNIGLHQISLKGLNLSFL